MLSNFMRCWESEGQGNVYELLDHSKLLENQGVTDSGKECRSSYFFSNIQESDFHELTWRQPRKPPVFYMPAYLPAVSRDRFRWSLPLFSIQDLCKDFSSAALLGGDTGDPGRLLGVGQAVWPWGKPHKVIIMSTLESSNKVEYLSVWGIWHCLQKEMV